MCAQSCLTLLLIDFCMLNQSCIPVIRVDVFLKSFVFFIWGNVEPFSPSIIMEALRVDLRECGLWINSVYFQWLRHNVNKNRAKAYIVMLLT